MLNVFRFGSENKALFELEKMEHNGDSTRSDGDLVDHQEVITGEELVVNGAGKEGVGRNGNAAKLEFNNLFDMMKLGSMLKMEAKESNTSMDHRGNGEIKVMSSSNVLEDDRKSYELVNQESHLDICLKRAMDQIDELLLLVKSPAIVKNHMHRRC